MIHSLHHNRFTRGVPPALRLAVVAALALFAWAGGPGAQEEPALLDAQTHPKFVTPVPNPLDPSFIFQPDGTVPGSMGDEPLYRIGIYQIRQSLGLFDPSGTPLTATVYGYGKDAAGATYPGRSFELPTYQPMNVLWTNNLVDESGAPLPHFLPVDTSVHWAMPMDPPYPASGVPVVTHVHGGHSESASDGIPEAWFTPGFAQKGRDFKKEIYHYDNDQEAGTIWYHDHALGITRLNVYAGLAGFFILRDEFDTGRADNPLGLPAFPYEIPLAIQDRMFTASGELHYPAEPEEEEQPAPSVLPEFFGDFILVNGQAWPYLDVEPRKYRVRLLNGSDSRFYSMWIAPQPATTTGAGPQIVQIGTDSGLLYAPVPLDQLTLGPGERADTVVDFAGFEGQTLILRNNARAPFPKGETIDPQTVGQIMAFRVGTTVSVPDAPLPATLRPEPIVRPGPAVTTRRLLLFEGEDEYGRLRPQLGTVADGPLLWDDPITENPALGDVEVWEIFNATEDAHPIHLHLVSFLTLNRQRFRARVTENGHVQRLRLLGRPRPAEANEAGWKDTVQMFPGEVTRVIATFDREGLYVWHCHILSHEDHEMMRPYCVGDLTGCTSPMP
jgi:spore coat protein A